MKKLTFRNLLFVIFVFTLVMSNLVFAKTVNIGGTNYTVYDTNDDDDSRKQVSINGNKYYVDPEDEADIKEALKSNQQDANSEALNKSLSSVVDDSKGKINKYGAIMEELQPDPTTGWSMLGPSIKENLGKILSLFVVIFWVVYIAILIWNGVNVLIPGMYDTTGRGETQNIDGSSKGKAMGFMNRFISKNSKKCLEQQEDDNVARTWIPGELKRLLLFLMITIGLTSGLFFNIITFLLGLFNFG